MSWQSELLKTLSSELKRRQQKNARFSIRAFSKKLKLSPAALSEMLRGSQRWKISAERAAEIVRRLDLPAAGEARLLTLMGKNPAVARTNMDVRDHGILLDWIYPAILSCHDLPPDERSIKKISLRLGIAEKTAKNAVSLLLEKGYLQKSAGEAGLLERNPTFWAAGDGPPSEVLMQHHRNNLKLALNALDRTPREERHYASLTFAGTREEVDALREEIRNFQDRIMNLMNKDTQNDEIFRISVCLFPIKADNTGTIV